jgi:hypothetical protein
VVGAVVVARAGVTRSVVVIVADVVCDAMMLATDVRRRIIAAVTGLRDSGNRDGCDGGERQQCLGVAR